MLNAIAEELCVIAQENGFAPPTRENFASTLMFVVTELDEAQEAVMAPDHDGAPLSEELADVAIRLLSLAHGIWGHSWADRRRRSIPENHAPFERIEVTLWPILAMCCTAVECWARDDDTGAKISVEIAIKRTFVVAQSLGVDLLQEIQSKALANKLRPRLHGKVRAIG